MTALAIILAMIPLALSTGAGAGAREAIGVTILGGMLAATAVGIFIIPTLFAVIQRLAEWGSGAPEVSKTKPAE